MMMKQAYYNFIVALTVLLLSMGLAQPGIAAPATQSSVACDQVVVVQNDDWLSKIAEKVYGDVLAYPAIAEATNAKHGQDSSFAKIDNVDVIETGWKLCVPSVAEAETLLERSLAAPVVTISPAQPTGQQMGRLVLATTTSTQDSGLLDVILPDFETRYSADVEVIAVGTGQALELERVLKVM
jgi:LysM repeat protein